MKIIKLFIITILILIISCTLIGCWNYREIENFAIVAGVAIEKDTDGRMHVTVESMNVEESGGSIKNVPQYTEFEGDTFFDAVRGMITIKGKRLYWSHAKVAIISEEIAKEDINHVLDFMKRDAEIREDIFVLVSRNKKASEILKSGEEEKEIISYKINDILKAQKSVSKFFSVELYEFLGYLSDNKTSAVLPTVRLIKQNDKLITQVIGTAIFDKNRMAGYLEAEDSRSLLLIRNKMKMGLFTIKNVTSPDINVALEIFKSRTKVTPHIIDGSLVLSINIFLEGNIGEITGGKDLISDEGRAQLTKIAEQQIKKHIENLIERAQKEYKLDFLNFKGVIKKSKPEIWRQIEDQWESIFSNLETQVSVNLNIRGSAVAKKPIVVAE